MGGSNGPNPGSQGSSLVFCARYKTCPAPLSDTEQWGDYFYDPNTQAERTLDGLRRNLEALSEGRSLDELSPLGW